MGRSKKESILEAYSYIGFSSYEYDLSPAQLQLGLTLQDSMMAMWNGKGIRLGYPLHEDPKNSTLDESMNIPDRAYEAVSTNLAVRLAPTFGKVISPYIVGIAVKSLSALESRAAAPRPMQLPGNMPAGAGNKQYGNGYSNNFLDPPEQYIATGPDNVLDFY